MFAAGTTTKSDLTEIKDATRVKTNFLDASLIIITFIHGRSLTS